MSGCWWCGAAKAGGDRFCRACGQAARAGFAADPGLWPAEGENRVLTVLFPDLCGYMAASKQAAGDEAVHLVSSILGTYIEVITRHGGFVARCIHDEVLALFGVPRASPDDPVRALDAALDIRTAIRALGLDVKIGVNTGLLYFGPVGNALHAELAVVGPAADVAARLVGKGDKVALPGQIIVGASTEEQARHRFDFTGTRVLQLKGIRDPATCHELIDRRAQPGRAAPAGADARWTDIAARVDALPRTARHLLQLVAVAGGRLGADRLARLFPDRADLGAALADLVARGWLHADAGGHALADPTIADVLAGALLPARRAALGG